jgi:hypothetical protein
MLPYEKVYSAKLRVLGLSSRRTTQNQPVVYIEAALNALRIGFLGLRKPLPKSGRVGGFGRIDEKMAILPH